MIRIIPIGKRHDPLLASAIADYEKRLRRPFDLDWTLLANSPNPDPVQTESSQILAKLSPSDFVILLDETGKQFTSPQFSDFLSRHLSSTKTPTFIIGGAYGVSPELKSRADLTLSLGPLVFPHQLVRLVLVEQIYRAQQISANHPYHHD